MPTAHAAVVVVAVLILCSLFIAMRLLPHAGSVIDCAREVKQTADDYPIRSPQAVHSAVASIVRGHDLVEIGTRHGDGMACFARFARTAFAIEKDPKYCAILRRRSNNNDGAHFKVACQGYEELHLDADYYTWWTQGPFLVNGPALVHLRKGQLSGKIRANATALVLLAHNEAEEHRHSDLLHLAKWKVAVPFAESRERKYARLFPEKGVWHVLGVPLSAVDVEAVSKWPDAEWGNDPQSLTLDQATRSTATEPRLAARPLKKGSHGTGSKTRANQSGGEREREGER